MKYVIMKCNKWENISALTPAPQAIAPIGNSIGFLLVYDTLEDLRKDDPKAGFIVVEELGKPSNGENKVTV